MAQRHEWQDLPVPLACTSEEVDESIGFAPQIPDAVRAGQRRNVEQDSTGPGKLHYRSGAGAGERKAQNYGGTLNIAPLEGNRKRQIRSFL